MIKDLLDLAKSLLGLKADLAKSALERRQRIGTILNRISDCLNQSVKEFREGKAPVSLCAEVDEYLYDLITVVGQEVGVEKLERYESMFLQTRVSKGALIEASKGHLMKEIEERLSNRFTVDDNSELQLFYEQGRIPESVLKTLESDFQVLEDSAGRFKALANSIQV